VIVRPSPRLAVWFTLSLTAAVWSATAMAADAPAAPGPAPLPGTEDPAFHEATGIRKRQAVSLTGVAVPTSEGSRADALAAVMKRIACTCYKDGDLVINTDKSVLPQECGCPQAQIVREDLERSLAPLSTPQLADKRQVAEALEGTFVPLRPEYERVFRYPQADYLWFMEHVRCVCEGCKATVFFSKCQLTCTPAILYKLRARVFMAMGFSRDELVDYYLAEYNADKPPREQASRDWLLPEKQKDYGWFVPAVVVPGGALLLLFLLVGWVRKGRRDKATKDTVAAAAAPDTPAEAATHARTRERLRDELDSDTEW
jgi:hypothetical protein